MLTIKDTQKNTKMKFYSICCCQFKFTDTPSVAGYTPMSSRRVQSIHGSAFLSSSLEGSRVE